MSFRVKAKPQSPRPPVPKEHEEQVAVFQWFRDNACARWSWLRLPPPDGRPAIFAVPNGGERDVRVASRLRAEGVSSGVPDLCVPALRLWIEMKRRRGGTTSDAQDAWIAYLRAEGYSVEVAAGSDEAISHIMVHAEERERARRAPRELTAPTGAGGST